MRTLYVSHNSVGSALVRSQVLTYARGLAERGYDTELITFERDGRFPESEFPRTRWHPIPSQPGASLVAKGIDISRGVVLATTVALRTSARLIHARGYVAAAIAAAAGALARLPYIFDMRGFLGEEYVDAGYWAPDDTRLRALRAAERSLLDHAAHIVVLTDAAAQRLRSEERYARIVRAKPITVIACAVDMERFRPGPRAPVPTLVYSGSLGSFYEFDAMLAVYREARRLVPALRFLILNRDDHELVRTSVDRHGLQNADVVVRAADFSEMPQLVSTGHVGIALVRQARSKLGSSAVKVAEYLASGLPVLVNAGLGDVDAQVRDRDAGHVMASYGATDVTRAAEAVAGLVTDAAAGEHARRLAEEAYDLHEAIDRYAGVYELVAGASTT